METSDKRLLAQGSKEAFNGERGGGRDITSSSLPLSLSELTFHKLTSGGENSEESGERDGGGEYAGSFSPSVSLPRILSETTHKQ